MSKEIKLSMITCPRRQPTINFSIGSIRATGYTDTITVFAEPGEYDIKDKGIHLIISKTQLGCFKNFHRAFEFNSRKQHFFCVLSDDFVYHKAVFKVVQQLMKYDSYHALYTPDGMRHPPCSIRKKGWQTVNMGWETSFGGLYVVHSEMARKIIAHKDYQNHLNHYKANQQIDHIIPKVCLDLGLDQWFNNPSLAGHIGLTSTIGHIAEKSKGLNFR